MTKETFNAFAKDIIQKEEELLNKKRSEYTRTDDVLDNFKRMALELNIDSKIVWWIFFKKHIDSVLNFVQTNVTHTEPILGRIMDARNYLLLLAAMVEEEPIKNRYSWNDSTAIDWSDSGTITSAQMKAFKL